MTDIEENMSFKNVGRCLSEVATDIEEYHVFVNVRCGYVQGYRTR